MTAPLQYGTSQASDPTAVMGRRTVAWIIDLLLFVAVVSASFTSVGEYVEVPPGADDPCQQLRDQSAARGDEIGQCLDLRDTGIEEAQDRVFLIDTGALWTPRLLALGWFAFFVILQGVTGGSPGKLLLGLRVVDQYGAKAGIGKSLGRTLLWVVDAAPWIVPLVGPITAFTSNGHRRVGDLAAGTYVVSSSRVGEPVMPASAPIPAGQTAWGAAPPTAPPTGVPGWQAPSSAPPPPSGQGWQTGDESGRWTPPTDQSTPDLDFSTADVPTAGERADEQPPSVDADPEWSRTPDLDVTPPPAVQELEDRTEGDDLGAPQWTEPTLPHVEDPADTWEPPTSPTDDWTDAPEQPAAPTAPFAAPGAEGPPAGPPEAAAPEPPPTAARAELPPPQWDAARNTYLQWEPNQQAWLEWDPAAQRWKPIDT